MSDNMERDKNERLTAREIEEEEMKRELTGIGIYESRMTYGEMKQILGFLNASGDTSNVASDNKNQQKGNVLHSDECLSELTSETDALQKAIEDNSETSRPMYSYKLNRTSPTITHEHKTARYCNSPESPSIFDTRNTYRRKSPDSDETSEKQYENCTHSTNRFISLRSGNISRECQTAAETKTGQNAGQSEHNQKLDRWRLNPLDVCINENDVPLRQPSRSPVRERMPFGRCKEAHTAEQRDQIVRALSQHLREMADLWYSWQRPTDAKFQWGSPIQVGTANGSLDRKPLTEPKTELIKTECTYRDSHSRASKRKANSLIASLSKESSTEDEDDQYAFARITKKRIQSEGKTNIVTCTSQQAHPNTHEKTTSCTIAPQQHSINDDDNDINSDEKNNMFLHSESRIDVNSERLSPELFSSPRRITPPIPKARLSLSKSKSKQKKKCGTSKSYQKKQGNDENEDIRETSNKKNAMTDVEICRKLEEDSDDEKAATSTKRDTEIRPLPLPKNVQSKLQEKRSSSNTKTTTETMSPSKNIESYKQCNKQKKGRMAEQQKKEEILSNIESRNISWEHQLMSSDNEDESSKINQESNIQNGNRCNNNSASMANVSCPICNKLFPRDKIEDHAANCEQFETNNEDDNSKEQLECNICNNYKTDHGNEYEEHVRQCIISKNNEKDSHESEDIDIGIDTVSTSFFRTYKPARERTENRTKIFTNKKRKH